MNNNYISVAKILNFHGIKGEIKAGFSKNREDFISALKIVYLKEKDNSYRELHITSCRFHKQHAILKFEEFNSVNDVLEYKGNELFSKEDTIKNSLKTDEFLISDLIGLEVLDSDECSLGTIEDVLENPANHILVVGAKNEKKYMVPFVKDLVPVVDLSKKQVIINNIEGLIE